VTKNAVFRLISLIIPVFNQGAKISDPLKKIKKHAVRQGIPYLQGHTVMFLDCDLYIIPDSIEYYYIERLITSDLVVTSNRHPKSGITISRSHTFLTRVFNPIIRIAANIAQQETQAGFKLGYWDIMRTTFRNANVNRYGLNKELFTVVSILHLKVQKMLVEMKIDRQFNTNEIVNTLVDVKHKFFIYTKSITLTRKYWWYIYRLNWKIAGVSLNMMVCSIAKYYYLSLLCVKLA
jgi:glycosyltransferase involved in cell wall biosynthesis